MLLDYRCEKCRVTKEKVVKSPRQIVRCEYCGEVMEPRKVQMPGYRRDHTVNG